MQYVRFGNTGMQVSRLCLGAMTFPNTLDLDGARRVLDEAVDRGVNFIDTADSYGESESVLGRILDPARRETLYLATKVYRRFVRDQRTGRNSRVNIMASLDRSLRLLRTDYVDLYQLHHPDPDTPVEETLSTLDTLIRQGKIRYAGVSNHYAWQIAVMLGESRLHHWEPPVSLQANYDILDRQVELETVPFCARFNLALMCYSPLAGGGLTGKYQPGEPPPAGSRGGGQGCLDDPANRRILDQLTALAGETGLRLNQLAILWLLAKERATTLILGGSRPEHFTPLYEVADRTLPDSLVREIDAFSAGRVHAPFRNQPVREGAALSLEE